MNNRKILVLDNYDSFVYNLVHLIRELGYTPEVYRNDKITLEEVAAYDKILLSPGPGIPSEAGIMQDLIRRYARTKSIMGVCLGHQAIGEVFGAKLYNLPDVQHGISSQVKIEDQNTLLFKGLPSSFSIAHYHSWVIDKDSIEGTDLKVTARSGAGDIMAIAHKTYKICGVQFHPESVLTEHGKEIMRRWLEQEVK
ncbi:aminodeoxychorismate/anthranilate synthase component II [Limibacter armeniacum]|uniref:anthranilate synthase component II n=1 Tax=Limibacter armeniacum TaxID=466084 RepID=UPI002FE54C39